MATVIKIEGELPYSIPHVDHISAIAHGENIDLTLYVALPGHADLEHVYVQLSLPARRRSASSANSGGSRDGAGSFDALEHTSLAADG